MKVLVMYLYKKKNIHEGLAQELTPPSQLYLQLKQFAAELRHV